MFNNTIIFKHFQSRDHKMTSLSIRSISCIQYINRQIAIEHRKCRKGMTFVRANVTLSTLLGFNLLVAIRANCKQTTQFSHFVILNRVIYRVYKKKLNKPEIALRLCKAPQCTMFFIEIGCLGTDNVV